MKTKEEIFKAQFHTLSLISRWNARGDYRNKKEIFELMDIYAKQFAIEQLKEVLNEAERIKANGFGDKFDDRFSLTINIMVKEQIKRLENGK